MDTAILDELKAIEASFESMAPWSENALSAAIRHVQRNTDVMYDALDGSDEQGLPGRYDGTPLARLRNILPRVIGALEAANHPLPAQDA